MDSVTNRTEPIFQGTTNLNSVNLGITTFCSMRCPLCSVNVPGIAAAKAARHAEIAEIKRAGALMAPMRRIHLTGGEPTLHPEFIGIAILVRSWFKAEYVTLETNGVNYRRYCETIRDGYVFDKVFITHYVKNAIYPGSPDNTKIIEEAAADLGPRLIREPPVVHERGHLQPLFLLGDNKERPCTKWFAPGLPAGWYNSRLYPCCVSFGIDAGLGIELTPDWRERIVKTRKGCDFCCYRGT